MTAATTATTPPPGGLSAWTLVGGRGTQSTHGLTAAIHLDAPALGLAVAGPHGDRLLALDLAAPGGPVEQWLRGDDLVAVYEPRDTRRLRATAYWRPLPGAAVAAWELVVSAQTALVTSDSALAVVCDVAAEDLAWEATGALGRAWTTERDPHAANLLVRRAARDGVATSVLIAAHPDDVRRIVVHRHGGRARIECWLFSSIIEKGVLLRSRVLAAVGPAADDTRWAADAVQRFAATPPPLSA